MKPRRESLIYRPSYVLFSLSHPHPKRLTCPIHWHPTNTNHLLSSPRHPDGILHRGTKPEPNIAIHGSPLWLIKPARSRALSRQRIPYTPRRSQLHTEGDPTPVLTNTHPSRITPAELQAPTVGIDVPATAGSLIPTVLSVFSSQPGVRAGSRQWTVVRVRSSRTLCSRIQTRISTELRRNTLAIDVPAMAGSRAPSICFCCSERGVQDEPASIPNKHFCVCLILGCNLRSILAFSSCQLTLHRP